jgi:hypothetical protein
LEVAKLDGSLRKILLDKNIQNPRGIAVNPELGSADYDSKSKINKSCI